MGRQATRQASWQKRLAFSVVSVTLTGIGLGIWAPSDTWAVCDNNSPGTNDVVVCSSVGGPNVVGVTAITASTNVTVTVEADAEVIVGGTAVTVFDLSRVTNNGRILGGDSSDGIAAGNDNTIVNNGEISAENYGINADGGNTITNTGTIGSISVGIFVVDDNTIANTGTVVSDTTTGISVADGNTITNSGTIEGLLSAGIGVVAGANTTLTNTGTILGESGTSINFGSGTNTLTLGTGSVLDGAAQGGTGTDSAILIGSGSEDDQFLAFEDLTMSGTDWALSGDSTFTATTIDSGLLRINGTLTSPVTVGASGVLGGTGTIVGDVSNFGTIAPGNSIGTTTVNGDVVFSTGSGLTAEVSSTPGVSDLLNVIGSVTIQDGATLTLVPVDGTFASNAQYTILTATGGITGSFTTIDAPLVSLTEQLSLITIDANTLGVIVEPAPGSRLINEAPFNPVNGGPASLLPKMSESDFWLGVTPPDPPGPGEDGLLAGFEVGFEYGRYNFDGFDVDTYTIPLRRTFNLNRPGWALVASAPIAVADAEGETAVSVSAGVGVQMPLAEGWLLTPAVRVGGVHSDDFRTAAAGYGGSLTSNYTFSLSEWEVNIGNHVSYYRADDVSGIIDDQIEYDTETILFRNGLVIRGPMTLFDYDVNAQFFVLDNRTSGDDLFVESFTDIGVTITGPPVYGNIPLRLGATATFGSGVSSIRFNTGYRF